MRIAIDGRTIVRHRTGVGVYADRLVRSLLAQDPVNTYALFLAEDDQTIAAPNLTKVVLPHSTSIGPNRLWENFVLPGYLRRNRFDIYFCPAYVLPIVRQSRRRRHPSRMPKMVVTIHDLVSYHYPETFTWKMRLWQRLFVSNAVRVADCILADSAATKADIHRFYSLPDDIVKVVHLPIDKKFRPLTNDPGLNDARARYGLPSKFILSVGTLEPRKNVVRLAQAYALLPPDIRAHYPLVLAGGLGWMSDGIKREIEMLHLQDQIKFLGYVEQSELPLLYNLATIFAYPSLYEGFGAPPVEAMACGTPVLASRASSLPEVVGDAGLLADPFDVQELSSSLLRLITDGTLRQRLSAAGIERAASFNVEDRAAEVLAIFRELVRY